MPRSWRLVIIMLLVIMIGITSSPVKAAFPRLMMVYGDSLTTPIIIDLWEDDQGGILTGPEYHGDESELDHRSQLDLGFFWGPSWNEYVDSGKPLDTLQPAEAQTHGRLYQGVGDDPPLVAATGFGVRELPAPDIEELERRGVPVWADRVSQPNSGGRMWLRVGLALLATGVTVRVLLARWIQGRPLS